MPSDTNASTTPVHGHGRSHGHGEVNYASKNREHYNRTAGEFEAVPGALELGASIGQGIRDHYAFNPEKRECWSLLVGPVRASLDHPYSND